ncbi:MAG: glycosyltransferase family 4 protein [Chloroflexi bacterium]|nr:MAG: glycosyltransferase family 4 protein [Chloroflexota bacterium]
MRDLSVGLDASVIFTSVGGTRVYATQLLNSLLEARPSWTFFLYTRNQNQATAIEKQFTGDGVRSISVPGSPNVWRVQARLPRRLRADRVDVYHSLGFFLPLRWPGPKVVTIHDLNMYMNWRSWMRPRTLTSWADLALETPLAAASSDRIVTDSEFSKAAICRLLRVTQEKVVVVPLAPDDFFDQAPSVGDLAAARKLTGVGEFVLSVGVLAPQKNLQTVIRAFAASGINARGARLLLAGSDRAGYANTLRAVARESGVEDGVLMPGFVSREILRALYHEALCVVLASHGEGFGLPLVEAMACGAPVIAANRQSLPEVVGDAGVLFEPSDVDALASALRRMHEEPGFRSELSERGRRRRAQFSWRAAAEATAAIYEELATRR